MTVTLEMASSKRKDQRTVLHNSRDALKAEIMKHKSLHRLKDTSETTDSVITK